MAYNMCYNNNNNYYLIYTAAIPDNAYQRAHIAFCNTQLISINFICIYKQSCFTLDYV